MQILKSLHASILHKSFRYNGKDIFCASALIGFDLQTGKIQLEQDVWKAIAGAIGRDNLFDMAMPKDNPEFLASGSFFAPHGAPVTRGEARIQFAGAEKRLCVQGDRHWRGGMGVYLPSEPQPFTEMPLSYARAFGGEGYAENADGIGFKEIELPDGQRIHPLPNVEDYAALLTSPSQRPLPASFMSISVLSERRQKKSGTYDEAWLRDQAPGLANDIDWSFFNDATPDQWLPAFPRGGEHYQIDNMHPDVACIRGALPSVVARVFLTSNKNAPADFKELPGRIDTVWFFPKLMIGVMIFRYTTEDIYTASKDSCILIAHENASDPRRPASHYLEAMQKRLDPINGYHWLLSFADFLPEGSGSGLEDLLAGQKAPMDSIALANQLAGAQEKGDAAKQAAEAEQARMTEVLKAAGINPEEHMKRLADEADAMRTDKEKELEALLAQLAALGQYDGSKPVDFQKMSELMPRIMQLASEMKLSIAEKIQNNLSHLKEDEAFWNTFGPSIQQQVDEAMNARPPLPRPPGKATLDKLKEDLATFEAERAALLAQGLSPDQVPMPDVDLHSIQQKLEEADLAFIAAYRMGSYIYEPGRAPHADRALQYRDEVLAAIAQHRSVAGWDIAGLDLSGQDFSGVDFSDAFMEDVNLTNTKLVGANLSRTIMARANLTNADCTNANLIDAGIGASELTRTQFVGSNLTRATLSKARLTETNFTQACLEEAQFLEAQFVRVDFSHAKLGRCNFLNTNFNLSSFKGADLSGCNFISPILDSTDFSHSTGHEVNFIEAKAAGCNFERANYTSLRFVKDCDLSGAKFDYATIEKSNLRGAKLTQASFVACKLDSTDFSEANLSGATLSQSSAKLAAFNYTNLQRCNLRQVNGMEATFLGARLVQANMRESNWYSANFLQATVGETRFDHSILDHTLFKDWRP